MPELRILITRVIDDGFPAFVECVLTDAAGQTHHFNEKLPVVAWDEPDTGQPFPWHGLVGCEIEAEWLDERGRRLVRVSTEQPWGVASVAGATRFVALASQLQGHASQNVRQNM